MRISGGEWCGRPLLMPKSELVRPTQDRVREALFNLLQYVTSGARLLDLYAGSGAVGLDALSRGAQSVTFLEQDRAVFKTLQKNLAAFAVESDCAHCVATEAWLKRLCALPFDIVFADPPYLMAKEQGFAQTAAALREQQILRVGGMFVTETDYRTDAVPLEHYDLLRDRLYGKTRLAIYKRLD